MKKRGWTAGALGFLLLLVALGYDTAPEGTHNIGLMQMQMMYFGLACILLLTAGFALIVAHALGRLEQAGVLPPEGYKAPEKKIA